MLWMDYPRVMSLSSLRFSSWKVPCIVQPRLPLPTLEQTKQHLTKSLALSPRLLIHTTCCQPEAIGIFRLDMSTTV